VAGVTAGRRRRAAGKTPRGRERRSLGPHGSKRRAWRAAEPGETGEFPSQSATIHLFGSPDAGRLPRSPAPGPRHPPAAGLSPSTGGNSRAEPPQARARSPAPPPAHGVLKTERYHITSGC